MNLHCYENKTTVGFYSDFAEKGLLKYEKAIVERFFAPKMRILDVGCGAGRTTKPLHDMGMIVTGIDFSSAMIEQARTKCETCDGPEFAVCNAKDLGRFEDESFDGVFFSMNGLALLAPGEKEIALKEFSRVLKANGIFIFSIPPLNVEEGYFKSKISSMGLDISNYYDRIRLGEEFFCDSGGVANINIPFESDMSMLLNDCGFDIVLKQPSASIADDEEEDVHETMVWVAKKNSEHFQECL